MRQTLVTLTLTLVLATAAAAQPPDVAELLAASKAAAGGDAWDKVAGLRFEGTVKTGGLEGTFIGWDDVRTCHTTSRFTLGPVSGAEGFDGEKVWSADASGLVTVDDDPGERQRAAIDAWLRCQGAYYPERWPAEIRYARTVEEGGRRFHVLAVEPEGGRSFELWLDASTFLPDRTVDPGASRPRTVFTSDYREAGGVLLPFAQRTTTGEAKYDVVVQVGRAEVLPEVDAALFQVPESKVEDVTIAGGAPAAEVGFELWNNHVYVEAAIAGEPLLLLVDTGGANVLTPEAAARLGLEAQGTLEARGVGEESEDVGIAKVGALRLGPVELRDQVFFVLPLADMDKVEGFAFDGLVGFEVFKRFVVTIDYAARRLVLTLPGAFAWDGTGTAVPFTFNGHMPQVEGEIDGVAGLFTIDTGSRSSLTLNRPFVDENRLEERYRPRIEALSGWGVGGPVRSRWARGEVLKLGAVDVAEPLLDLFVGERGAFADRHVAGNVGGGVLRRFAVTFDYGQKRMILRPNGQDGRRDADRAGMWLNRDGDGFRVEDVVPGGPADEAGLAVGERVVAVDGHPAAEVSLPALRERLRSEPPGTEVAFEVEADGETRRRVVRLRDLV